MSVWICQCKGSVIICDRQVPRRLPDYIRSVELIDIDMDAMSRGLICNQSWTNIKHLAIKCLKTCRSGSFVLGDNVFQCLDQLETLQLSHNRISSFNRKTFTGLHNVDTLDLTNCRLICSQHLLEAFSDKTVLPQLTKLILVKTCVWNTASRGSYLALNQEIIDVLGERRNLTELNLSWTNLRPETKSGEKVTFAPLCDSEKILNISNAKIDDSYLIDMTKPCASLRVLDLSGINIPKASAIPQYKGVVNLANYVFHLSAENVMPIGMNVSTLYLNGLHPSPGYRISMHNIVINITFPNELKELHLSGYDLLDLDVNIIGTANRLTYMDISNNKIANIGADVFKSANLERINLANNNLSRTDPFDATFSALFSKNTRLWEVTLAGNQLNHVPKDIFHSNSKLRSVYLSENEFSQISFALGHLKHLTLLDMKKNKIRYLDKMSRINIDELH